MYDSQNLRTVARGIQRRAEYASERDKRSAGSGYYAAQDALARVRLAVTRSDDLRRAPWRGDRNPYAGHCYVAAEALWHMLGAFECEYRPHVASVGGWTHWWLESPTGARLDPTADQFPSAERRTFYAKGRACGFLTRHPSKRAAELMRRAGS